MPRVRSNVARLKRKKQVMKAARGAFGARPQLHLGMDALAAATEDRRSSSPSPS